MLMRHTGAMAGFSLLEMLIVVAVVGIAMMAGLPSVSAWIQNTHIRTAAEGLVSGLQLARAEALRRNASVSFYLVDTLTAGCAPAAAGPNWVVSLADPSGKCDVAPSDAVDPFTVQKRSGSEGSANAVLAAAGGSTAVFNGIGRVTGAGNISRITVSNPSGGACKTAGGNEPMRCLRVDLSSGGEVRMCDPSVDNATDSRACAP